MTLKTKIQSYAKEQHQKVEDLDVPEDIKAFLHRFVNQFVEILFSIENKT